MSASAAPESPPFPLRAVTVRPTRGSTERRRWDALMSEHHYLPYHGLFGRLHLIANNARFLILPQARAANLASRFTGTCYRVANWHPIGFTRGYACRSQTGLLANESGSSLPAEVIQAKGH